MSVAPIDINAPADPITAFLETLSTQELSFFDATTTWIVTNAPPGAKIGPEAGVRLIAWFENKFDTLRRECEAESWAQYKLAKKEVEKRPEHERRYLYERLTERHEEHLDKLKRRVVDGSRLLQDRVDTAADVDRIEAVLKHALEQKTSGDAADGTEHDKPGIDWQELLMMPPLCAAEIAGKLGEPVADVERILRYFRTSRDYGFINDIDAGFGEAVFRYKMPDVLAYLQKWYAKRQKKAPRKPKPADG